MTGSRTGLPAVLVVSVTLAGCAGAQSDDGRFADERRRVIAEGRMKSPLPERAPAPVTPVKGEAPEDLVARLRSDVVARTGADPSEVHLVRDEAVVWSDGSLGCPEPGEAYPQFQVPGYRVVFELAGREYDYRCDDRGQARLCERPELERTAPGQPTD
jgi:hypothetical protein